VDTGLREKPLATAAEDRRVRAELAVGGVLFGRIREGTARDGEK
jgi:hypothetical protein